MRFLLMILLCAAVARAEDSVQRWSLAVEALTNGDAARARPLFEEWIAEQGKAGIASPEAHFNLALACWQLHDAGCASYQLLQSAALSRSPFIAWRQAERVADIEREVGMKEGLSNEWPFRAFLVVNRTVILWLLSIGFWIGAAGVQALFTRQRRFLGLPAPALFAGALVFGLLGTLGWLNRSRYAHYAVLSGKPTGVALLKNAGDPEEKKLADLPNGILVSVGDIVGQTVHVDAPVDGWVAVDAIRRL